MMTPEQWAKWCGGKDPVTGVVAKEDPDKGPPPHTTYSHNFKYVDIGGRKVAIRRKGRDRNGY